MEKTKINQGLSMLDKSIKYQIYKYFDYDDFKHFFRAFPDYDKEYMYSFKLMNNESIQPKYFTTKNKNDVCYQKLYNECPYLKNFPALKNSIVAGGFINIAIDKDLNYNDYPTSDIDIFVCGMDNKNDLEILVNYFDQLDAKYKTYRNIINVYIPNYNRNFQIIWTMKETIYDCLAYFHASHLKCGLFNDNIILSLDCEYTINSKISIINDRYVNAYTLSKIISRNYCVPEYAKYDNNELQKFKSITDRSELEEIITSSPFTTSETVLTDRLPNNFQAYTRVNDLERINIIFNKEYKIIRRKPVMGPRKYMIARQLKNKMYDLVGPIKQHIEFEYIAIRKNSNFPTFNKKHYKNILLPSVEILSISHNLFYDEIRAEQKFSQRVKKEFAKLATTLIKSNYEFQVMDTTTNISKEFSNYPIHFINQSNNWDQHYVDNILNDTFCVKRCGETPEKYIDLNCSCSLSSHCHSQQSSTSNYKIKWTVENCSNIPNEIGFFNRGIVKIDDNIRINKMSSLITFLHYKNGMDKQFFAKKY